MRAPKRRRPQLLRMADAAIHGEDQDDDAPHKGQLVLLEPLPEEPAQGFLPGLIVLVRVFFHVLIPLLLFRKGEEV